ncbi:MAG: hypothetical protein JNM10_06765 [Planctomycetia bacterium]|nr:hypothetical protein [Planctomycetia bacterium]
MPNRATARPGLRAFVALAALVAAGPRPATAQGIPADVPFVSVDPRVDGAASFAGEWTDALAVPNSFVDPTTLETPGGTFYYESRVDWTATSSSGNTATYPGNTFFIAHDIWGSPTGTFQFFKTNDASDWNYVKCTFSNGTVVECWCFGGFTATPTPPHGLANDLDEPDDGPWITGAVGLGASSLVPEGAGTNLVDDRGFIARLGGDPATDRHWFPGDPEPGDAGWDWDDFYGCFARAGFNDTFTTTGTDPVPAHAGNNEVYEWCFHESAVVPPLLECTNVRVELVDPPKRTVIHFAPDWFLHFGDTPVPALPWPAVAGLAAAVVALLACTRRRGRAGVAVGVLLTGLLLVGCGGGGGGGGPSKAPPPVDDPVPVLPNGLVGQPYAGLLTASGDFPPFTFTRVGGQLPPGLQLAPGGQVTGTPTLAGEFEAEIEIADALGRRFGTQTYVRIDRDHYHPIELVSLSLHGVSPTLAGQVGQPMIGAIEVRGGDPLAFYQFQPVNPSQLPPGVTIFPNGIIRGTPTAATPGPVNVGIRVTNGASPPVDLAAFFDVFP